MHEDGHDRAAALVKACLDDGALGGTVGVGAQLLHLGQNDQVFQQVLNAHAGLGGDRADDRVAAPFLADEVVFGQLLLDALGVGADGIHLVDGHDHGDVRGLGVVDALHGLRHDAVVRGDHQDGDIGDHGAAGAHGGEGLVARGVEEGDGAAVDVHGVGADVLGDAAGLACGDLGVADVVQQRRFAVVDVAHDHHDRGARLQILFGVLVVVDEALLHCDDDLTLDLAAHFHGYQRGGIIVDNLGHRGEHAQLEQLLDDLGGRLFHAGGQLAHGDLVGDLHLDGLLLGDLQMQLLHLVALLLAALVGGLRRLALLVLVGELLLVAALHAGLGGLLARQVLKLLVIFLDIHGRAAAGVHHALLRDLARRVGLLLLLGLRLLGLGLRRALCRGGGRLGLAVALRGRGLALCGSGLRLGLFLLRRGFRLRRDLEDLFQALHLVVLGHVLKDHVQLRGLQHLHMILRRRDIVGQDLGDHFRSHAEILGHLMHAIFDHTHPFVLLILVNCKTLFCN